MRRRMQRCMHSCICVWTRAHIYLCLPICPRVYIPHRPHLFQGSNLCDLSALSNPIQPCPFHSIQSSSERSASATFQQIKVKLARRLHGRSSCPAPYQRNPGDEHMRPAPVGLGWNLFQLLLFCPSSRQLRPCIQKVGFYWATLGFLLNQCLRGTTTTLWILQSMHSGPFFSGGMGTAQKICGQKDVDMTGAKELAGLRIIAGVAAWLPPSTPVPAAFMRRRRRSRELLAANCTAAPRCKTNKCAGWKGAARNGVSSFFVSLTIATDASQQIVLSLPNICRYVPVWLYHVLLILPDSIKRAWKIHQPTHRHIPASTHLVQSMKKGRRRNEHPEGSNKLLAAKMNKMMQPHVAQAMLLRQAGFVALPNSHSGPQRNNFVGWVAWTYNPLQGWLHSRLGSRICTYESCCQMCFSTLPWKRCPALFRGTDIPVRCATCCPDVATRI